MKIAGIVISLIIAALLFFAAVKSPDYSVSRQITLKASSEAIFPLINNNQRTFEWMPWKENDSAMEMSYQGPEEGVGARAVWTSNGEMGHGSAEITESIPNQKVVTALEYTKPMEMSQTAEITLTPIADGTVVKWSVHGKNSFVGRLICMFMNMDAMVGSQFEKGLANLQGIVESPGSAEAAGAKDPEEATQ